MHELEDQTGTGTGGFVWVDIPEWSEEAEDYLRELGCHEMVLEACRTRNHVPTVHAYADHVFITAQSPLLGKAGHVHLLELDQVIGRDYLVTVHGPLNPVVELDEALVETDVGAAPDRVRAVPAGHPARALLRDHLGRRTTPARADQPGGREAARPRAARDGLPADQPRGAAGADVPDPPRADHHAHDGGPVLRRLGPDGGADAPPRRDRPRTTCATSPTSSSGCAPSPTGSRTSCSA